MRRDPLPDHADIRLMARLAKGDRPALGELAVRHQHRIFELAYRCTGDWGCAEDIVQDAFLRLWHSADRYEPRARFTTWLHRIVINLCLDSRKKRTPVLGEPPDRIDETTKSPMEALVAKERSDAIQRAVARLPDRQRVVLVLHRFSGFPIRRITDITGFSESAVESLLVRAYTELRKTLKNLKES